MAELLVYADSPVYLLQATSRARRDLIAVYVSQEAACLGEARGVRHRFIRNIAGDGLEVP